jgi:PAS domain-containing protein
MPPIDQSWFMPRGMARRRMRAGQVAAIRKAQAVISFTLDGVILDANENFLNAVGYTLDEIRGRHHEIFVDAATRGSADYGAFWAALIQGMAAATEELAARIRSRAAVGGRHGRDHRAAQRHHRVARAGEAGRGFAVVAHVALRA